MNTIWFFGDSYIDPREGGDIDGDQRSSIDRKSWTHHVAQAFPTHESKNLAIKGSSLDHMYTIYNKNRDRFERGDIVVLTLTIFRRLFLSCGELRPNFLHKDFRLVDLGREDNKEGEIYYKYFESDLFNLRAHMSIQELVLNAFRYDAIEKGIKIVVLPITDMVITNKEHLIVGTTSPEGNLVSITVASFIKKFQELEKNWFNKPWHRSPEVEKYDHTLANHLTPENNKVLANKVIHALKTNAKTIDLTTDWII